MHSPPLPLTRDLVLIGGGHTHALVLRKWGMNPLPGVRVTLINPGPTAPYSGMLPGHVAGHYNRDALDIDLVKLARFSGARVVLGAADGIDPQAQQVHVPGRPSIEYDVLSVDVGITSDMPALPGFAEHAAPAKPLGPFATRWGAYLGGEGPASVAVIGGGVAGAELAMAMAFALRTQGRMAQIHLIDADQVLSTLRPPARLKLVQALNALKIAVVENASITRISAEGVHLADGRQIDAAFVTGAAGARPYGWIRGTGLDLHDGFIRVDDRLRSSDPSVFAVGDCAHLAFDPRPKAGVYAVRQAPVLYDNLRATLSGTGLRPYRPQKDYLKLISLGGKAALGDRFGMAFSGAWVWRWKDHIDQKFMHQFRDLPKMPTPPLPWPRAQGMREAVGPKPMCGGCGSKVGRATLSAVLGALDAAPRDDIQPPPGDDAALLRMDGVHQVISTDHLRTMVADPVVMTRITAQHALNDIWAMGAAPQAATATLILPRLSDALTRRTLSEIMQTAHEVMADAGAAIVGGHSSVGDELTIGFTITGLLMGLPITLAGARPGDQLILTRPIGTGVVMAAEMAGAAEGAWVAHALAQMSRSNRIASSLLTQAHAMTDVTGFGLAGHLLNLCQASGVGATLHAKTVPLVPGALDLATKGVRSTLFEFNRAALPGWPSGARADLMVDPQTSGGLLAALSPQDAKTALAALQDAGEEAAIIGEITDTPPQILLD